MTHWHIITGEFYPMIGGLSDHTALLTQHLTRSGDQVTLWTPPNSQTTGNEFKLHVLPDHFGSLSTRYFQSNLRVSGQNERILLQYVPHMFGRRGMNYSFIHWFSKTYSKQFDLYVHEVAFPIISWQPIKHRILALVQRSMAKRIARHARRIYVTIPAWNDVLATLDPEIQSGVPIPVPSTISESVSLDGITDLKQHFFPLNRPKYVIGSFGTYPDSSLSGLEQIYTRILSEHSDIHVLLLGRHSSRLANNLPDFSSRITSLGFCPAADVAKYLAICDLVVQPYIDGISCRRTTAMASLALGTPMITNVGPLSESFWSDSNAIRRETWGQWSRWSQSIEYLLTHPNDREILKQHSAALYRNNFSWPHTLESLRSI
jgi:glycosyltransferase involved in cell wall biosynthesis